MPVWRRDSGLPRQRVRHPLTLIAALLWATLLWSSPATRAEFKVAEIQPHLAGDALVINGNLDLALTPKVEEALSKGIELPVIIELRLYRKRTLLWDQRLANWSLRRSLQYHALSGQYLVSFGSTRESFLSLAEALKYLGSMSDMRLPLAAASDDDEHMLLLRAYLDIEALPTPLRPVAYTTPSWHLNSGWSKWNVARSMR